MTSGTLIPLHNKNKQVINLGLPNGRMYASPAGIRSVFVWSCLSSLVRGSLWSSAACASERNKIKKHFGYPRKQPTDYHTIRKALTR